MEFDPKYVFPPTPPLTVKFKKLDPDAKPPFRAHPGDSGADLHALENVSIQMGETALLRTGIALQLPVGYEAQVRPRSGLSSKGVLVAFGTVDNAYTGEVKVVVMNFGRTYTIHKGDRIAQLVIAPIETPVFEETDVITHGDRGTKGFGSSGV